MASGVENFRIAVGMFDSPGPMLEALRRLLMDGFGLEQLACVALATTFEEITAHAGDEGADRAAVAALLEQLEDWRENDCPPLIRSTRSGVIECLRQVSIAARWANRRARHESDESQEIEHHVRKGGIALIVRSMAPVQQSKSTRILLQHSSRNVRTYELTLPVAPNRE